MTPNRNVVIIPAMKRAGNNSNKMKHLNLE